MISIVHNASKKIVITVTDKFSRFLT